MDIALLLPWQIPGIRNRNAECYNYEDIRIF